MILEKETYEKYGYYPSKLKPQSHKKILVACDDCGKVRIASKHGYRALCRSCVRKGEKHPNWKGGKVKRICQTCGGNILIESAWAKRGSGKFCSLKCMGEWKSKNLRGENCPAWKGGTSFEPYCTKFNNEFKEYIRDKFGRVCFLCSKTEEENGKRLSVHHCNGNKNCGCDGDETCQFVPLCVSCHSKVHSKKVDWEAKIKAKMQNKLNGWYI